VSEKHESWAGTLSVWCDYCLARVGQKCESASGKKLAPVLSHAARHKRALKQAAIKG